MYITRREFLILSAGLVVGCKSVEDAPEAGGELIINAGPVVNFTADGVYDRFRNHGFYLVRRGDRLVALSSFCTHRKCKLTAEPDRTFFCECHGSTFDPDGKVTKGPARRDLPNFAVAIDEKGDLRVTVPGK